MKQECTTQATNTHPLYKFHKVGPNHYEMWTDLTPEEMAEFAHQLREEIPAMTVTHLRDGQEVRP